MKEKKVACTDRETWVNFLIANKAYKKTEEKKP